MAENPIEQGTDEDLFRTLDPKSNSIASIIKYMAGSGRTIGSNVRAVDSESSIVWN
jgi:hypothetical protein